MSAESVEKVAGAVFERTSAEEMEVILSNLQTQQPVKRMMNCAAGKLKATFMKDLVKEYLGSVRP